ncbi:MAG: HAMP domain-containing histidine kinase [Actinomycetota bacterium]|nr:HAMP domain-containing histidine kinase [Actinomycetota bacterium]
MLGFVVGALAVSVATAGVTYQLAQRYLLAQRERSAVRQAYVHANLVRRALTFEADDIPRVLASLELPARSHPLLLRGGRWSASSLAFGSDELPLALRRQVADGAPARQRFWLQGVPRLAVGVPLPAVDAAYFEVASLSELNRTLQVLRTSLSVAAAVTVAAGAAAGRWATRRVLQPLGEVAAAAAAVTQGRLNVRLHAGGDADLAVLTDSFNQMTDALRQRVQRDARFASAVSHELRSPLTTLATSLEVLTARRDEMPERAGSALDLLASELRRFQRLVEDLLEISRADSGAADLSTEGVRLSELVPHALRACLDREIPVDVDAAALDLVVAADKRRLERVMANLIENAETYGEGVVRVSVESGVDVVRVAVEDAGPGVPEGERQRIFERFARGRAAGRRSSGHGTGLGLALVDEHVRLHGGRVWVEDRPGGGARFVVELPVVER